jgi:hypothetical protein
MARKNPGAKVPKSSGQGVSRASYQTGYRLGNRGSASAGGAIKDAPSVESGKPPSGKASGRAQKGAAEQAGGMNVSYGDTLPVSDLEDVKGSYAKKPKSGSFLKAGKGAKLGLKLK